MELPHEPRHLGNKGRKATHDFLSLYSSPVQQDPTPSQDGHIKTHDFLLPLGVVGKDVTKEENRIGAIASEKPLHVPPTPSVEHILPGGIGTYSISHFNQRILKPDKSIFTEQSSSTIRNDDNNSNCSSYTGSGFTLWNESAVKQGQTRKENISADRNDLQEAGVNVVGGQWPMVIERQSQSSSNHKHTTTTFSSFSSFQPSSSQKNQSFMDMITSAKNDQEEDEEDEDDEEFAIKKEPSSQPKDNLPVKVEAKNLYQKPNTPRSKHSATEQRRRSKINDRFQKLREIIPNSEQKRDKASFLLEVIEYIQSLQEKVNKYETPYTVWNHEPAKMMQWSNNQMAEVFTDPSRGINMGSVPTSLFASKSNENKASVSLAIPMNGKNLVQSDMSTVTTFKQRGQLPELTSKESPLCTPIQPNILAFGKASIAASSVSPKQASDVDNIASWPPPQLLHNRSCTGDSISTADKLKNQEIAIDSGTISISSVYSRRLLNTLTQALQSSGVDLSQASISVQIDLGKTGNGILNSPASIVKDGDAIANSLRSRVASTGEEFDKTLKRLRTS